MAVSGEVIVPAEGLAYLANLEKVVTKGLRSWETGQRSAGQALYAIQARGLWALPTNEDGTQKYATFTAYVKAQKQWTVTMGRISQMVTAHANALIESGTDDEADEAQDFLANRKSGGTGRPVTAVSLASQVIHRYDGLKELARDLAKNQAVRDDAARAKQPLLDFAMALDTIDVSALTAFIREDEARKADAKAEKEKAQMAKAIERENAKQEKAAKAAAAAASAKGKSN